MMKYFVLLTVILFAVGFVSCDKGEQVEANESSVKIKRGIHGYATGFSYPIPTYGHGYSRYTPYTRFPGIYKSSPIAPAFAISPGNAVVHSYNVNYPKPVFKQPVYVHPKPVSSVPIYAHRYPLFVQKPVTFAVPQFGTNTIIPAIPPHIHTATHTPQPSFISQDGWRPIFSSVSSVPSVQGTHISQPANTVLPPLAGSSSATNSPNNFYLPPEHSAQNLDQYHQHRPQQELQAHLQHLQQIQEFQHHQNFFRNEHNNVVTPLTEQGYETASNNGQYAGPSSYDVQLNSH